MGTQRSGTSWWYRLLCDHPQIHTSPKEIHFFDGFFGREFSENSARAYHRLFPRPPGCLVGEWTPRYMHLFWTPPLLRRAAPDARILILLRDPMRRYQSGVNHETQRLMRAVRSSRREYVAAMERTDALNRSLYSRQLEGLLECFEREQVLVLQYEQCVEDPAAQLRRTYEFLGADPPTHLPPGIDERRGQRSPQVLPPHAVEVAARRIVQRDAERLKALVPDLDLELWASCRDLGSGSGG